MLGMNAYASTPRKGPPRGNFGGSYGQQELGILELLVKICQSCTHDDCAVYTDSHTKQLSLVSAQRSRFQSVKAAKDGPENFQFTSNQLDSGWKLEE